MSVRDVGSPGVQGAGPRASQVRVKRRGDNHKVAMLTMVRPAPGHCPVRSSPLGMLSEGGGVRVTWRKRGPGVRALAEWAC